MLTRGGGELAAHVVVGVQAAQEERCAVQVDDHPVGVLLGGRVDPDRDLAGGRGQDTVLHVVQREPVLHRRHPRRLARQRSAAGRDAEADEIASVVAFLMSNESRWINGQTLAADGGVAAATTWAALQTRGA